MFGKRPVVNVCVCLYARSQVSIIITLRRHARLLDVVQHDTARRYVHVKENRLDGERTASTAVPVFLGLHRIRGETADFSRSFRPSETSFSTISGLVGGTLTGRWNRSDHAPSSPRTLRAVMRFDFLLWNF